MKSNFDFDNWTLSYGPNDGTLGSSTKYLKDYIKPEDIFWSGDCDKPIIKRSGITALMKGFNFVESDVDVTSLPALNSDSITYLAFVYITDTQQNVRFIGDGEASYINLRSKADDKDNIALRYPIAMAIKRARSRAVLNYLGIDAYGEDESPEFRSTSVEDIKNLPQKDLDELSTMMTKRSLAKKINEIGDKLSPKPSTAEFASIVKNILGMATDTKITLGSLSVDDMVKVITTLEIMRVLGPDAAKTFNETT